MRLERVTASMFWKSFLHSITRLSRIILGWSIVLMVCNPCVFSQSLKIRISAGHENGTYYPLAESLQAIFERGSPNSVVSVQSSAGSVENAEKILNGSADLAFIQNDVAFCFREGVGMFETSHDCLTGIASLYTETVHILVFNCDDIRSISDLKGKIVSIGEENSGTQFNAQHILTIHGIGLSDIKKRNLSLDDILSYGVSAPVDAAFLTAGVPTVSVVQAIRRSGGRLLSIDDQYIKKLKEKYPYYCSSSIEPNTYIEQPYGVKGVGIRALLAAHKDMNPVLVYRLLDILFNEGSLELLKNKLSIAGNISRASALTGMSVYLHRGARQYYREHGMIESSWYSNLLWIIIFIPIVIFIFLLTGPLFFKGKRFPGNRRSAGLGLSFFHWLKRHKYSLGLLFILSLLLLDARIIQHVETQYEMKQPGAVLQDYYDIKDTLVWLYVLSGCGYNEQRFPQTLVGKVAAATLPFIGFGGLIALGGVFVSDKIIKKLQGVKGMEPSECKDHIIICGWNERAPGIVKNLTNEQAADCNKIVILAPNGDNPDFIMENRLDDKYAGYVNGKATVRSDLDKANFLTAKTALILSNPANPHCDDTTVLSVLAIEKYCDELIRSGKRKSSIYTIAELMNPENRIHLENAECDEIISTRDISEKLIVHSAMNQGLSRFISEILTFSETNEVYSREIASNSKLKGNTFDEISSLLRERDTMLMAIQIEENTSKGRTYRIMTNPVGEDKNYQAREGDKLLILAENGNKLKGI